MQNDSNIPPRKINGTFQLAILHPDPLFADEGCSRTIVNRFWKHVVKTDWCWNWIGDVDPRVGTGTMGKGGKAAGNIKVRRVSFMIHYGIAPPNRIRVTCKNPCCVNPEHFSIGYGRPLPPLLPEIQVPKPVPLEEMDYASQDPGLPTGFSRTFMKRFLAKIDRTSSPHGCWLWGGAKNQDGYGMIGRGRNQKGNVIGVHIAAYRIYKGDIPEGHCVCHDCPGGDNPACCNPDHLWLGPPGANTRDAIEKSKRQGKIHWRSTLSPQDVQDIRATFAIGDTTKAEIGRRYRVSPSAIGRILNHLTHRHFFLYSVSGVAALATHTGNENSKSTTIQWKLD